MSSGMPISRHPLNIIMSHRPCRAAAVMALFLFLTFLSFGCALAQDGDFSEEPPKVLILHAYYPTFEWTTDVTEGITSAFADSDYSDAELFFEYMDARRHPNPEYRMVLEDVFQKKYNNSEFDLIIAVDDHAINFVSSENGMEIFGNAPVVFCGANSYDPSWRESRPDMTGLTESIEPVATAKSIFYIQPDVNRIFVVNDNISLTSMKIQASIESAFKDAGLDDRIVYMSNMGMDDLGNTVSTLPDDSAVLLFTYNVDSDGNFYSIKEYVQFVSENSNVPVYGVWDVHVPYGSIGGKILGGKYDGKFAAEIGMRILNGENASEIPIIFEPHTRYIFNWEQMERYSISEGSLPEGSIIVNGSPSFYDQYKTWIWLAIIALILQSVSIGFLVLGRSRLNQTQLDLMRARKKAEENDILKSVFLANMSHEIRTPMNAILGFSELLKNPLMKPEKSDHYIDLISTSGKNLMVIMNDILDISRIESGDMEIIKKPFYVNTVLDDLFEVFSSKMGSDLKNVDLRLNKTIDGAGPSVNSDEARLRQVLTNLLGNAVKFTDAGYIECGYTIKEGLIEFYVKDTGSGIAEELQTSIFNRFQQVEDGSSVMYKGTGLGLSISRSLVELMGGNMWVESVEGEGAVFYFTLDYLPLNSVISDN